MGQVTCCRGQAGAACLCAYSLYNMPLIGKRAGICMSADLREGGTDLVASFEAAFRADYMCGGASLGIHQGSFHTHESWDMLRLLRSPK